MKFLIESNSVFIDSDNDVDVDDNDDDDGDSDATADVVAAETTNFNWRQL